MYQNVATRVLTGEVRLSYVHLSTPYANPRQPGAAAKYSATLLIPKTDAATKADIEASMEAAAQDAVAKKWGGFRPPRLASVLHDGDGVRQDGSPYGEECKGCWVITASSNNKPPVVDISNINSELAPQDIYSGMYARVCLNFYGYSTAGNKGVGCGLQGVMKTRDGEPLSGSASGASLFAGVGQSVVPTASQQDNTPPWGPAAAGSYTGRINPVTGQPM